ncbi:AAA domain-containing protein [Tenacibaculum sp. 190524A02b]|uniref:AAA domain-containing protein n=1 Tax=Tenacibaculum vairaonense TaxID=3137860 RepID=A0ABM9PR02_9FLAO
MSLTEEFKEKIRAEILKARDNFTGTDKAFSKTLGINNASFSRIKNGDLINVLASSSWLQIARELNVKNSQDNWVMARTKVYTELEGNLKFCQDYSKAMIIIDDCGLGKSDCAMHIARGMKNTFFVDCSQGKTKTQFIKLIAKTVGLDVKGRFIDVKNNLKYYLNNVLVDPNPLIVLDDSGYLEAPAFLEIQELLNGTKGSCGWYMIGDESFQEKIERGIRNKKIGYRAIFSRFSDEYVQITPIGIDDKRAFYKELLWTVAEKNVDDKTIIPKLVTKCLKKEASLRYLRTLIEVMKSKQNQN